MMSKRILLCWVGKTDLNAAEGVESAGQGPIAQVAIALTFDRIVLLSDLPQAEATHYCAWLQQRVATPIDLEFHRLSGPTQFGEIYEAAVATLSKLLAQRGSQVTLSFHLSPGTPAMAAVWIILAKTRFPAELIESSKEYGVKTVSFPFDISADFIPALLQRPDNELSRLSAGLPPEAPEFARILHRSEPMKRLIARARKVALRSIPVLLEGETGTGKELLARAIHQASTRRNQPFIAVNCGAIATELAESELFGHTKGAFTGAIQARAGHFREADGGTLFLDEIGELPKLAQVKLLRVLQESEVVPVGASQPIKVNVRIIAATNRSLSTEIACGAFREDLFYRLAVAVLKVPPLRERPGDVSLLIDHLLEQVNVESETEPGYKHKKISAGAKNLLLQHHWPGNVRELLSTLRRAAVWSPGTDIEADDIRDALLPTVQPANAGDTILHRPIAQGIDLSEIIQQVARHYLERALGETGGNKTQAAKLLGLANYQTLSNWMNRYGITTIGTGFAQKHFTHPKNPT